MLAQNLLTLGMLILLQIVLGLDNLLYISLESKNVEESKQKKVRLIGISLAIIFRIGFLFLITSLIKYFQDPFYEINLEGIITGEFNVHSLIVYLGGGFILYTAVKEIWHLIASENFEGKKDTKQQSIVKTIVMIVIMNIVFSFDSTLSAIALTDVFWIMAVAIVVGGLLMIWLSDKVSNFLHKNKMFEVLGLFVLLLVGIMLITEAAHLSELYLFGQQIMQMNKATFYFVLVVLVIVDVIQGRYQKKLNKNK